MSEESGPDFDRASASSPLFSRESFESIIVAFLLAFLIRNFEAEAFVIPTGSMAPTLMGWHKDITCDNCQFWYRVGGDEKNAASKRYINSVCPNCRYGNYLDDIGFSGDRILVSKYSYAFASPKRWDVAVFRYPEESQQNYIKRVGGVGPEQLRIYAGDLYRRAPSTLTWQIVRKPPEKLKVLQFPVHDSNYPSSRQSSPDWQQWIPENNQKWQYNHADSSLEMQASDTLQWILYRHLIPNSDSWKDPQNNPPQQHLIDDFYAYNASEITSQKEKNSLTSYRQRSSFDRIAIGNHWVGDLTFSFQVSVNKSEKETLAVELIEGIGRYRATFTIETGRVNIHQEVRTPDGTQVLRREELGSAITSLNASGTYHIRFSNADDRLLLWINDNLVKLGKETHGISYHPPCAEQLAILVQQQHQDYSPVILYPGSSQSANLSVTVLQRLQQALDRLELTPERVISYEEDTDLNAMLNGLPSGTPLLLIGDFKNPEQLIERLHDIQQTTQLSYYGMGPCWPNHGVPFSDIVHLAHLQPTLMDFNPVRIGSSGSGATVRDLRITRDIYYVAQNSNNSSKSSDYVSEWGETNSGFFTQPEEWPLAYRAIRESVFELKNQEYLMLGDNSPRSKDSRLWYSGPAVVNRLLIGKAFFIYWPHGLRAFSRFAPFVPRPHKMRFIR